MASIENPCYSVAPIFRCLPGYSVGAARTPRFPIVGANPLAMLYLPQQRAAFIMSAAATPYYNEINLIPGLCGLLSTLAKIAVRVIAMISLLCDPAVRESSSGNERTEKNSREREVA
jgi:hypothetical protein